MKKVIFLLLVLAFFIDAHAQKKKKDSAKAKTTISADYNPEESPDTLTKFTGIIKYKMTSDDPSEKDSMFIIFGEQKIRVTMFQPGYRENDIFENNMIADFQDSTFTILDVRRKTYTIEKLGFRNPGMDFVLSNSKKTIQLLQTSCKEYKGEMKTKEGDVFQIQCMLSNKHSYLDAKDYNFLNIQPAIIGYKIVLGYHTRSANNENSYIVAYKIEPCETSSYFDLSPYQQK